MVILPFFSLPSMVTFVPRCSRRRSCATYISLVCLMCFFFASFSISASSGFAILAALRSTSRTDQPFIAASLAKRSAAGSSFIPASTLPWPALSLPSFTMVCTLSGRFNSLRLFAIAGRLLLNLEETSSCVRSCCCMRKRIAAASSIGLRLSLCRFSTSARRRQTASLLQAPL